MSPPPGGGGDIFLDVMTDKSLCP